MNHTRGESWLLVTNPSKTAERELHEEEALLRCWRNYEGHCELLPLGHTVYARVCSFQLQLQTGGRSSSETREGCTTSTQLPNSRRKSCWEILTRSAYSQDVAPSVCQMFRALKLHLRKKKFNGHIKLEREMSASSTRSGQSSEHLHFTR